MQNARLYSTTDDELQNKIRKQCRDSQPYLPNHQNKPSVMSSEHL